ncbi:MAG: hypothetical protein QME74_08605 [Candidatus Edwardsbacteria bacterium]|nr:hypothetical protein [Candidatus Edwardsbacteria bacterium]
MRGLRKYRTPLEARLDMYREMWERGFDAERVNRFFIEFEEAAVKYNLPAGRSVYQPGLYFFRSFDDARADAEKRMNIDDFSR